jgi:predicted cupin superfamily sugar epimerase
VGAGQFIGCGSHLNSENSDPLRSLVSGPTILALSAIMVHMRALLSCITLMLAAIPAMAAPSSDHQPHQDKNKPIDQHSAQDVIKQLGLVPNVEKGYYIQTFEDSTVVLGNRSASTAIYYLLEGKDGPSRWHRVADVEIWHYYAGAPLTLSLSYNNGSKLEVKTLGSDIFHGQAPQIAIGKQQWQSARSLGRWTLVGTTGRFIFFLALIP